MTVSLFTPEVADILPSKRHVAFRAGHKALPGPGDPIYAPLAAAYREGTRLITPRGAELTLPATSVVLPAEFAGVTMVTLGVTTVGAALDDAIAAAMDAGHTLPGVLLDAFGSEAVECVSEALDALLRAQHPDGGTRRFSPGYGDLSILENAAILSRLGVDFVTANPATGILHPRKSTVFLIGWY